MPRKPLKPTDYQRGIVKSMAAFGIPQEQIARQNGIRSAKTLRKHFRDELDLGATRANYKVAQTLYNMAISGECPAATIFWSKTRLGFRERPNDKPPAPPAPFIVTRDIGGGLHDQA
jgi:hypothetical protein